VARQIAIKVDSHQMLDLPLVEWVAHLFRRDAFFLMARMIATRIALTRSTFSLMCADTGRLRSPMAMALSGTTGMGRAYPVLYLIITRAGFIKRASAHVYAEQQRDPGHDTHSRLQAWKPRVLLHTARRPP